MTERHKVFLSYHHGGDRSYKEDFLQRFRHVIVDWSVREGDIPDGLPTDTVRQKIRDEFLRDSTVTIVLVGANTWQRKHVDWEIGSSLRRTEYSSRSGLLGILLPTYPAPALGQYSPYTIPPRLADNLGASTSFAALYHWTTDAVAVQRWIHEAYVRRDRQPDPDNSFPSFATNRSGDRWYR